MPDSKVTDLTSAGTLDGTEVLYAVKDPSGTPLDRKTTAGAIKTLSIGAGSVSIASGKTFTASNTLTLAGTDSTTMTFPSTSATIARTDAGNTFTGAQTFSVGTVNGTGLDISQTWTGTGTYTGLKYNVGTDSGPSNAASRLLDLQVGGTPAFYISKNTDIVIGTLSNKANFNGRIYPGTDGEGSLGASFSRWGDVWVFKTINIQGSSGAFTFSATDGSGALTLTRAAAATLQLGAADAAAPVAQTLQVQSVVAGTTNTAGADFTIKGSASTGSAQGGSISFQTAAGGSSGTAQNSFAERLRITTSYVAVPATGTNSGANPGLVFLGLTTTGFRAINNNLEFWETGTVALNLTTSGKSFRIPSDFAYSWASSTNNQTAADLTLLRDAANTLALKNSTNPQIFRAYSTTTGPSYGYFASGVTDAGVATADTLFIGTGGAGAAMTKLALVVNGTTKLDYNTVAAAPNMWFNSENSTNRTGYYSINSNTAGGARFVAGVDTNYGTEFGYWGTARTSYGILSGGRGYIYANLSDGFAIANDAGAIIFGTGNSAAPTEYLRITTGGLITFGGTTSSFPALKRVSANLQVIAGDGSSSAGFIVGNQALATAATDGFLYVPTCAGTPTGTPTTQTGTAPIVVDTTNNKLYFYSGGQWRDAGP